MFLLSYKMKLTAVLRTWQWGLQKIIIYVLVKAISLMTVHVQIESNREKAKEQASAL